MRVAIIAGLLGTLGLAGPALALDKVTFGTNWLADPEAGGYFQALVDGTYEKYGLDVTILPGGPSANGGMLLIAGKIEFFMGGDMIGDFLNVQNNIPTVTVAADFQKNPQCFMSHPGVGLDKWEDLPNANPAFVSAGAINTFWAWMRVAYGFKDDNIKPYNFNSAPFIVDKHSIQQGYATSEPFEVERQGGFKPNVFLLADYGYDHLFDPDHDAQRDRREEPGSGAALRQRLRDRLVSLPLRRQLQGQRRDQERKPRADRRADRVLDRQAQGIRHRRFRRHA